MYNPTIDLDNKEVSDIVPVGSNVPDEAYRTILQLCMLCKNGASGREMILSGQRCELKILENSKYIVNVKTIEKENDEVLRLRINCKEFSRR